MGVGGTIEMASRMKCSWWARVSGSMAGGLKALIFAVWLAEAS